MAFTDIFIRRPVLASVVSLLIILLGMQAFNSLTVRQYPAMENALITITTSYPGANAEVIQGYITQPIQQSLASAEGVDYISSVSRQNVSVIEVNARLGVDTDRLFTDVMSKTAEVRNQLPAEAQEPVIRRQAVSSTALMYISFSSEDLNNPQITDYLSRVVQPRLATLPGIAEAKILGRQTFAMRLWLNPVRMGALGVTAGDINQAIRQYNYLAAAGETKGEYVVTSVNAHTDLQSPEQFAAIAVKTDGDKRVLLSDVARIEMGAESYDAISFFSGTPSVYISIEGTTSANPIEVISEVRAALPTIEEQLPPELKLSIAYDATVFIQASINEVIKTLLEAVVIVIVVVFLFLGSLRSVIIPVVTIPLSMIGVLFFMQLMGYSINLLTLLALVLAIGLVVDDAIVVVENIHRHIEEGLSPFDAALKGTQEIAMPVVAMTITLAAVYAPIGFLQGLTGALFKEFAFTLAGAVIISGIVALTLSPMMCSRLLREQSASRGLAARLDRIFHSLQNYYQRLLHRSMDTSGVIIVFGFLVLLLIPLLLMFTRSELAPAEDQSFIALLSNAPKTANLEYLTHYTDELSNRLKEFDEYAGHFQINGMDGVQNAFTGMIIKPWAERNISQKDLVPQVQKSMNEIAGLEVVAFNMPALPGAGGGLPVQFVINTPGDYQSLLQVTEQITQRAKQSGKFAFMKVDLAFDKPEISLEISRDRAAQMNVSMADIGLTLASLLGEGEINRFSIDGRSYRVIAQVEQAYRDNSSWLNQYQVRNREGQMLPLGSLITASERARPTQLNQFQQLNAARIQAVALVSMSDALQTLESIAKEEMPSGYTIDYAGASRQFKREGSELYITFALALALIYLVLAAQFESFRDPLVILVTVPLSICGALIPLFLGMATMNIYTQVGLVTLIGIISKHGILIVEFANQLRRQQQLSMREAVETAAAIRLRPVLMTTASMVFAMVPLLMATGAGAVSRFDIGLVIASGLTVGTVFTLFVLPAVYVRIGHKDQQLQ